MFRNVMQAVRAGGTKLDSFQATEATPMDDDALRKELAKFQGGWTLVYWLYNGKEMPTTERNIKLSFLGEKFVIHEGDKEIEEGAFEGLDPVQRPKVFTYAPTVIRGLPNSLKFPAIYMLQDDVFIACVGYDGIRPRTFSAEAGSKIELVIYMRIRN